MVAFDRCPGNLGCRQVHPALGATPRSARAACSGCSSISPRECCILKLIGQGYSNKRVARALGITSETVKWYVKRVFLKLDVNTRAHAVVRAQSLGLFGVEFVQAGPDAQARARTTRMTSESGAVRRSGEGPAALAT
jgi:DNA-binding CsgD family transcriptional regulator